MAPVDPVNGGPYRTDPERQSQFFGTCNLCPGPRERILERGRPGVTAMLSTCVNDNGDRYVGKGIQEGEIFFLYLGEYLVVYRVRPDRTLTGRWAHARGPDTGRETLTPIQ